jgi:diguanylate cyclase (GGDEF)-like protein
VETAVGLANQHGSLVLGLGLGALALAILLRMLARPKARAAPPPVHLPAELARLRAKLSALEGRYQAQLEFFVNFPEVVKSLTAALTREQVTSACSRALTALLHTRRIAIFLAESRSHLRLVDGAGFPGELRDGLSLGIGELGLVELLQGRGVSSFHEHESARRALEARGIGAELVAPVCHGEQTLGLLVLASTEGDPRVVHRMLAMVADLTGVALHAAHKVSQIRDEAERDGLTGLANRRTLTTRVQLELQRARAYGTRTSLAMIDIDHFKHYNDQNGHAAGDEALRAVAGLIQSATRRTDLCARYGGEEFTVILAGADREQAIQHAERIRQVVAGHSFSGGPKQPLGRVSISVGVATYPDDGETAETLFERADRALYQAKHLGRDRVVGASQSPSVSATNTSAPGR